MHLKKLIALCGAIAAVLVPVAVQATAATGAPSAGRGTTVTIRIEGLKRTLLATATVHTHAGWITKGGTPRGTCPATSAAGAMDAATHHRWGGKYSASVGGLELLSILGEKHAFTSPFFWEIFVGNRAATVGACELKLHAGEQLLFAAVSQKKAEYPIAIRAPRAARVGRPFTARVVWFNAKGLAKPLAGATVSVNGPRGKTGRRGTVSLVGTRPEVSMIHAAKAGFIRAAPVRVRVSG